MNKFEELLKETDTQWLDDCIMDNTKQALRLASLVQDKLPELLELVEAGDKLKQAKAEWANIIKNQPHTSEETIEERTAGDIITVSKAILQIKAANTRETIKQIVEIMKDE